MRRFVVVVASGSRADEALRAAVGLTLRGDRVDVVRQVPLDETRPATARALAALRALGGDPDAPLASLAEADGVEVWSDRDGGRPLLDDAAPDKLVDLVLAAKPVILW
jgi:hypothetical protein